MQNLVHYYIQPIWSCSDIEILQAKCKMNYYTFMMMEIGLIIYFITNMDIKGFQVMHTLSRDETQKFYNSIRYFW